MTPLEPRRGPIVAIACLSMVSFGIVFTALGASLPHVIARFGIDKREAGAMLSLLGFSVLAGSLVFGPIVDRRGYKPLMLVSFTASTVGLEAIAFAPSPGWLRAAVALIGFSGALVNGAANALVVDVSPGRRTGALAFMAGFFGAGAAAVPLALGLLAGHASHAAILAATGVFFVIPLAMTVRVTFPPEKQPQGFPLGAARDLLRDPVLLLIGLMLFLESGMESIVGGWSSTLFVEAFDVGLERAQIYLAVFWLGLMLGRFAIGALMKRGSGLWLLVAGMGTAFTGAVWLVTGHAPAAAGIAVFLIGCGFAPVFPVLFGVTGDRYPHLSGTALGLALGMALMGGMSLPYATGVLAGAYGLRGAFVIVPASLVGMAILFAILRPRLARVESPS